MEKLLKTTEVVLGKHKLPFNALHTVHNAMRDAKKDLDLMLGLNKDNLFRVCVELERNEEEVRRQYPQTYAVVAHLLNLAVAGGAPIDMSSISLVNNTVLNKGQEGKLSRILNKQLKGNEDVFKYCSAELGINKIEQFLPKLGDIVRSGRKLWISTNILDFLYSSEHASFTSCHSMSGCHFNGNLAYARDGFTVITFVTDEKATDQQHELYKLGRSWLFVVDDLIIQPKSYGAYYDFERDVARQFIESKLAEHHGIPNKWSTHRGQSIPDYGFEKPQDFYTKGGALYLDNYALDVSAPAGKSLDIPRITFSAAMCLECGQTTDYTTKGVCSEHDGKVKANCPICGERHLLDQLVQTPDGAVCHDCYRKTYQSCQACGNHHRKDSMEVIDGNRVCPDCKKKFYSPCPVCKELHKKDRLTDLKGVGKVCVKCQDKFLLCGICGDYHPAEEVIYYKYLGRVCNKCLPDVSTTCESCGEVHPKADVRVIEGSPVCPVCVARREGEELTLKAKPKYADLPEGWEDYTEIVG